MRSTWEIKFSQWLDANPNVIEWSSESTSIYYYDPIQKKQRRYFPDFYAKILNKDGKLIKYIIEIKPEHETIPPKNTQSKAKKTVRYQEATYLTNQAKWNAAEQFSKKMGMRFLVLNEKQLFRK